MCALRNRSSSSGDGNIPDENSALGTVNKLTKKIKLANNRVKLHYIFSKTYKINIQITPGQEWSLPICCPFPSHDDSTASFGYNSVKDYFHCFGCSTSGRAVEFMSRMEGLGKDVVADQILRETGGYDVSEEEGALDNENFNIDEEVFKFPNNLRHLYQKFIDNERMFNHIDKIAMWLDMSLISALSVKDADSFKRRVEEADMMLKDYYENEEDE